MGNGVHPLRGPQPTGTVEGLKLEEVRTRLTSTNPEKVAAAGHAYDAAAGKLTTAYQELAEAIDYLSEHWRGPAASEALAALTELKDTATALAVTNRETGKALQRYGEKILPWYKNHLPGDGFIRTGSDDDYAQKFMARLNSRITQTHTAVPGELRVRLPGIEQGNSAASTPLSGLGNPSGGDAPDATPSSYPAAPGFGSVGFGGEQGTAGWDSSQSDAPGSDLASVTPGPEISGPSTAPGPATGGAAAGGGVVGEGLAPPYPGMGARHPALGGGGRGSMPGGAGHLARGSRTGPAGQLSPSAHVIGGPGGAARSEEEQRKRSTWLAEDRDVWGVNEELAPPVINGLNPATPANERPTHGDNADRRAGAGSKNSGTAREADEKDDLDLLLDELEAELDLEIAELGEEAHSATEEQAPALGDGLDGLLGDHVGDATDAGYHPRTAR